MKNVNSQPNIAVFSAAIDSENKIIQILHRNGQKKNWRELSSSGQEPTFKTIEKVCFRMRVKARADSRQMQIPAKWTRADQSVHAQSYHSICRSYTPDGQQDTCLQKFSKLSIMLTSPAFPYALAEVKIEPSAISTGN